MLRLSPNTCFCTDLLIDKQELVGNKVLKVNSLCGSDTMDVSVGRQFEGKIFGFRKNKI